MKGTFVVNVVSGKTTSEHVGRLMWCGSTFLFLHTNGRLPIGSRPWFDVL